MVHYPVRLYGICLDHESLKHFLEKNGYVINTQHWKNVGWIELHEILGLEKFKIFNPEGDKCNLYFGVPCQKEEDGKIIFDKAFPNVEDAKFTQIWQAL